MQGRESTQSKRHAMIAALPHSVAPCVAHRPKREGREMPSTLREAGEPDRRLALEDRVAQAFWLREPGCGEIRPVGLPEPGPGDVAVRTLRSGISRGTETLVFRGAVPIDQRVRMRAPFQEGDFPGPLKYGYLNVGAVEEGPTELRGRTVFCLYPHQTAYVVPAGSVSVVPEDVPPARAVLAGTVETAINALWDAAPAVGDRVAVVGAGMVGCCVARLMHRYPAVHATLVDVDPGRADVAAALGVDFRGRAARAGRWHLNRVASARATPNSATGQQEFRRRTAISGLRVAEAGAAPTVRPPAAAARRDAAARREIRDAGESPVALVVLVHRPARRVRHLARVHGRALRRLTHCRRM
jgi:hypothetical protein